MTKHMANNLFHTCWSMTVLTGALLLFALKTNSTFAQEQSNLATISNTTSNFDNESALEDEWLEYFKNVHCYDQLPNAAFPYRSDGLAINDYQIQDLATNDVMKIKLVSAWDGNLVSLKVKKRYIEDEKNLFGSNFRAFVFYTQGGNSKALSFIDNDVLASFGEQPYKISTVLIIVPNSKTSVIPLSDSQVLYVNFYKDKLPLLPQNIGRIPESNSYTVVTPSSGLGPDENACASK